MIIQPHVSQSVNNHSSGTFPPYLQVWHLGGGNTHYLGGDITDLFIIWVKTILFLTHYLFIHYLGEENTDLLIIWLGTTLIYS